MTLYPSDIFTFEMGWGGRWGRVLMLYLYMYFHRAIQKLREKCFCCRDSRQSPPVVLPEIHLGQGFGICGFCEIVIGFHIQESYKEARPCPLGCFSSTHSYVCPFMSNPAVHWEILALFITDVAPTYHLLKSQALPWIFDNQMLPSRPPVCFKYWACKDRFTCTTFVLWGANFMSWKLACSLLWVFNKPKCLWSITPMAAFYWLIRTEKVHLKMECHLKFMGWQGSQLIIISHVKMWFPSPCFLLLRYWRVLSKFPSLWQGTSTMVMLGNS